MGKKSKNYGNAPKAQAGANVAAPAPPALITRFLAAVQQAPLASQDVPDWSETEILGFVEQLAPESRGRLQGFLEQYSWNLENRLCPLERERQKVKNERERAKEQ